MYTHMGEVQLVHQLPHKHHARKKPCAVGERLLMRHLPHGLHHQATKALLYRIHMQHALCALRHARHTG